jgi:hypothetical protein
MKKTALLLAWLAFVSPLRAAEESENVHERAPKEAENPLLSLLLLPANLLARIAAAMSSPEPPKDQQDTRRTGQN